MPDPSGYDGFSRLIEGPDERIDLLRSALEIASPEYESLDAGRYVGRLEELAEELRPRFEETADGQAQLGCISRFLYDEKGFAGNSQDYYDLRNSYLNEVLERRTGIPITLAIVYIELAARLDLDVRGVGFPGHFLVKCPAGGETIVDPFDGRILTQEDCETRFRAVVGDALPFGPRYLEASPKRGILARVLGNLKHIHLSHNDFERALGCSHRILLLLPDDPGELRDRGLLHARLECFAPAVADLERFLLFAPEDPAAQAVEAQLSKLRERAYSVH
ncbi:MAG: tetratricopeptide repeat protein [Proteobacteria bacterium]|nr:tetratricopeptide repeat protein [Pseudomonadota bacterium]